MEAKHITPFEELAAMLVFGSEVPLTTVGQVKEHLANALMSQGVCRLNNKIFISGIDEIIEAIAQATSPDDVDRLFLMGVKKHMLELMQVEALVLERDIVVMEGFLSFMDIEAGTDRGGEDIPF